MLHHRKRTKLAYLLTFVGILVLAMATNAFLQQDDGAQDQIASESSKTEIAGIGGDEEGLPSTITTGSNVSADPAPDSAGTEVQSDGATTTAAVEGESVVYPGGPTVVIPSTWHYAFSSENGVNVLSFGTQNFTPESPYSATMQSDASGYIVPSTAAPSEAVGPLVDEKTVRTQSGQEVNIRTYATAIDDVVLNQSIATFTVGETSYAALLYADSTNTEQHERFILLLQSISSP